MLKLHRKGYILWQEELEYSYPDQIHLYRALTENQTMRHFGVLGVTVSKLSLLQLFFTLLQIAIEQRSTGHN